MRIVYDIGIRLYFLAAWISSIWNKKAGKWVKGRKGWLRSLDGAFDPGDRVIWFHCASLGEFEQGRPVIEAYRQQCPAEKILLTFFSPSGYEKRKDFAGADRVMYLPLDTARNARRFIKSIPVKKAVFIKYEFWFHFLRQLKKERIPVYLASGIFRPGQIFFRWYGRWYRRFLEGFTHIFVQQEASKTLLEQYGFQQVSVAGDTRFDRVRQVKETPYRHRELEEFTAGRKVIVAGSTWETDEQLLVQAFSALPAEIRWIIAPHELTDVHIRGLQKRFPGSLLFTTLEKGIPKEAKVVIVDTIGHLSYLYRYGTLAYIGGGFGKGIHNILEAATYGLPVMFGPNHRKFTEAEDLIRLKGAFPVSNVEEMLFTVHQHFDMNSLLKTSGEIAARYVVQRIGATSKIIASLCKTTDDNNL
jgi:3-deoxy-D-manno-octulosonic-acid transferase